MLKVRIDSKYAVGEDGNVYSDGLPLVKQGGCVRLHGERKRVSYLVARTFLENAEGRPYVRHKNRNLNDDRAVNLEWCESEEALGRRGRKPGVRRIVAWNSDGECVGEWNNATEAAMALGLDVALVRAAAERRGKTGGFVWQWKG